MNAHAKAITASPGLTDHYATLLAASLAAYALIGKGFAYAGVPPLFITEFLLVLGLLVLVRTGCLLATLASVPNLLLAFLLVLVVCRTVPYVTQYRIDALRDSVIGIYGVFALIVTGLLLERPERLVLAVRFLRGFTTIYVLAGPILFMISISVVLPTWPVSGVPFVLLRGGELGVHLTGCVLMALLGLRSHGIVWCCTLLAGFTVVAAQSRSGLVAILVPLGIAVVLTGRWRRLLPALVSACLLLSVAYAVDLKVPSEEESRAFGARQIVENMASVVVSTGNGRQDGTKLWRQMWWQTITDYTFHGPYFWGGKGFGINLAEADGFTLGEQNGPGLRSPHNSHMAVLARMGVPGLALWCLIGVTWMGGLLSHARIAWRRGDEQWGNLLLLILCYWLSIAIDAAFDVALEGPMLGVWFWSLFGLGGGTVLIYRAQLDRPRRQ